MCEYYYESDEDREDDLRCPGPGPGHIKVIVESRAIALTGRPLTTAEIEAFESRLWEASRDSTGLAEDCIETLHNVSRVGNLLAEAHRLARDGLYNKAERDRLEAEARATYYVIEDETIDEYMRSYQCDSQTARTLALEELTHYDPFIPAVVERLDGLLRGELLASTG